MGGGGFQAVRHIRLFFLLLQFKEQVGKAKTYREGVQGQHQELIVVNYNLNSGVLRTSLFKRSA